MCINILITVMLIKVHCNVNTALTCITVQKIYHIYLCVYNQGLSVKGNLILNVKSLI